APGHETRSDVDTNTMAAETGGAALPNDVSTTGIASGYVPQPVTTAPEHTGAGTVVGQSLFGAAEGTSELAVEVARSLALNALTPGIYRGRKGGSIRLWAAAPRRRCDGLPPRTCYIRRHLVERRNDR
ncbi:MAG TPA: hypothetical protein VL242_24325, partial [Sorangium sp.]|nr:hypothetical protein [Sorangium sp.]